LLDQLHQRQQHLPIGPAKRGQGSCRPSFVTGNNVVASVHGGSPLKGNWQARFYRIGPNRRLNLQLSVGHPLRNLGKRHIDASLVDHSIEPRLAQVFAPLLSIIEDENARGTLQQLARDYHKTLIDDRGMDTEAQVLEVIAQIRSEENGELSIKAITERFIAEHGQDYDRKITPHWVGHIIRKKLGLRTEKRHGNYVISPIDEDRLTRLLEKYGIGEECSRQQSVV
jgi:hypothetical protein